MRLSRTAVAGAGLLALSLVVPLRCRAQDAPAPPPEPAPAPRPAEAAPPAGLLPVQGGKVRIGMPRTGDKKTWGFAELVAWSVLGRMSGVKEAVETELSPCVGEHFVSMGPYFLGKYEVTNAQYVHFLKQAARVEVVIPPKGKPGPRTLEAVSREFLLAPMFKDRAGKAIYPVAVDWEGLYDLNEELINPVRTDGTKRPPREAFQNTPLPAGLKLVAYRYTVPGTWRVRGKTDEGKEIKVLKDAPLPGTGDQPVTGVSLVDAMACARFFGCHVPTEAQWENAARGPKGEPWPTGEFEPLGMAWSGFNTELLKAQDEAKKKLARNGNLSPEEKARLEWIVKAKEIDDPNNLEVPVYPVGLFPLGAAPCGALDLLGNADEWVSTPLHPYPGTNSKSAWIQARSQVYRGGNALDRDIFLTATIRKTVIHDNPLPPYARYATGGFRMARYAMFGASAASPAAQRLVNANRESPILPGEIDPKTRMPVFVGLDIEQAAGIDRVDEVLWDAAASPASDPTGKVFHLGPAYSLCLVPADGMPFRDIGALRKAADRPVTDLASGAVEKREPRDIPFLGLLHLTDGMEIKGEKLTVTMKEVPLAGDEAKRQKEAWEVAHKAWEERKKAAEDAAKEEKDKKDKDGGGGDGNPPPDDKKMAGPAALIPAPGTEGGDGKGGKKKEDGAPADGKPEEHKPDDADPALEEEPETDPEPIMVTTKKVPVASYGPGFLKGAEYPDGLLVGMVQWEMEKRVVLWEARTGRVGTSAPGGGVLLEPPLMILPKECIQFRKVGKPLTPFSTFDPKTTGMVELGFYIPMEGKSDWFEFKLKIQLTEFPPGTPASPWRATTILEDRR